MVHGIGQEIRNHLFHLKLIPPDIYRTFPVKFDIHLFLCRHDGCRLDHAVNQLRDIKPCHFHGIIAKLQLIECQQLLYHMIHLFRFIHNHITVKITALCIIIDAFF